MALTKDKKKEIIEKVQGIVNEAESIVFVKFGGLSVQDTTDLRQSLRESDSGYFVAKKTLLKRALQDKGHEGEMPELPGEIAIAYGSDSVMPAKGISNFAKGKEENISIVGGVFEGKYMSAEEMKEIASIPGMEQLRGMFVNVINSPIQGFVIALDAIAKTREA